MRIHVQNDIRNLSKCFKTKRIKQYDGKLSVEITCEECTVNGPCDPMSSNTL